MCPILNPYLRMTGRMLTSHQGNGLDTDRQRYVQEVRVMPAAIELLFTTRDEK
jgi:hypothetical protein